MRVCACGSGAFVGGSRCFSLQAGVVWCGDRDQLFWRVVGWGVASAQIHRRAPQRRPYTPELREVPEELCGRITQGIGRTPNSEYACISYQPILGELNMAQKT